MLIRPVSLSGCCEARTGLGTLLLCSSSCGVGRTKLRLEPHHRSLCWDPYCPYGRKLVGWGSLLHPRESVGSLLSAVTSNSLSFQLLWLYGLRAVSSPTKFIDSNVFYRISKRLVWYRSGKHVEHFLHTSAHITRPVCALTIQTKNALPNRSSCYNSDQLP
jgi:hypothetical protein